MVYRHIFQLEGQLFGSLLYPILGWNCEEWAAGLRACALRMCPHLGLVAKLIGLLCEVEVKRVPASMFVVLTAFDMYMYGRGLGVGVFVGVLRGDDESIRQFELDAFSCKPVDTLSRV